MSYYPESYYPGSTVIEILITGVPLKKCVCVCVFVCVCAHIVQ